MKVWPVIQPQSAVQNHVSSLLISKTYFVPAYVPTMKPPTVCSTPLGLPVLPEV